MDFAQLLVSGLANGCVYGLIALGFVLIYKASEAINFAQGDMMMLGAFVTLALTNDTHLNLPFLPSVLVAIAIMATFGYLLDALVLRHVFGQPQIAVVILTIAFGYVIRFVTGLIWGHEPQSLQSPLAGRDIELGGIALGLDEIVVIVVTSALTLALYLFFARTRTGVAMQAASQNQLAAYYMGVPVRRMYSLVWGLSGALAAIAGVLFASKGSIDPNAGLLGIKAFAAAIIGGFGSLPGALLGGVIVGVIEPFASRYGPSGYAQIAPYLLLVLVLVLRPNGLLPQVQHKKV